MARALAVAAPAKVESGSAAKAPPARKETVSPVRAAEGVSARLNGGAPLPPTTRRRMERAFGRSFAAVRVHSDAAAAEVTSEHAAEALTVGSKVAFAPGKFEPGTPSGERLMAHELAHVAQQGAGGGGVQACSTHSDPGEPAERAAEEAAGRVARGERNVLRDTGALSTRARIMRRARNGRGAPAAPVPGLGGMPTTLPPVLPSPTTTRGRPAPAPPPREGRPEGPVAAEPAREGEAEVREEAAGGPSLPPPGTAPAAAAPPAPTGGPAPTEEAPPEAEGAPKPEEKAAKEEAEAEAEQPEKAAAEPAPAAQRSPASPGEDPAFQAVVRRARAVAERQGHNTAARRKAAEAQAAAAGPPNEVASQAAAAQVGRMDAQEPQPFDRASFKAALLAKIAEITPRNLEEADEFKESNAAATIKGDVTANVAQGKEQAQGPIQRTTEEAPDPSVGQPKEVAPLPPTEAGPPPPDLGAAGAAPKPKAEAEVSLAEGSQSLDQQMADAGVTEGQLANGNEPAFTDALAAKGAAQTHAAEAPPVFREQEQALLGGARTQAEGTAATDTRAMHGLRGEQFGRVAGEQESTQTRDEQRRVEVADHIEKIYEDTKQRVESRLEALDGEVNGIFDSGAESARQAFEDYVDRRMSAWKYDRYLSRFGGGALWLKDKLFGLPDEVNVFYREGRDLYIGRMDAVIDDVATAVETGLNEAKEIIGEGQQEVRDYVEGLPEDLRQVGEEAAGKIQERFDELRAGVNRKRDQLIDSLAQKYVENLNAVDARIEEMKAANRGLVDRALDAIGGVIKTILELKAMLEGVLARAVGVIETILSDPIGFIGNLVTGVKMGLEAFVANIGTHLQKGLMGWLFGALAGAGIQMPESFDLRGILSLVLQVLGLTYANIRSRAVRILGEPLVSRLEQAAEIFLILVREGPAGLWEYIKDQIGNLKDMVIEGIKGFVIEKIIVAGITWVLSLLNPASAFVKAVKAIIDIVMFFVNRASQIMALVNAVLDSLAAIAGGSLGAMASAVENALARAIPVAIGFLASLLGLGGISEKIRAIIMRVQAPVNRAIDWVIRKAVQLVKAAGRLLGIGRREGPPEAEEPVAEEGTVRLNFSMDTEGHTLTAKGENGRLVITIATTEMEVQAALAQAAREVSTQPKFPGKRKVRQRLERASTLSDYNLIRQEWERRQRPGQFPKFLEQRVREIASTLSDLGSLGIPSLSNLFAKLKRNDGPYGHLPDPPNVDFGEEFSGTQRRKILEENRKLRKVSAPLNKSDVSGVLLDDSLPMTDPRKPNIDHIFPKSAGGSNSYSNAQVLARDENAAKSAIIVTPPAFPAPPSAPSTPSAILRRRPTTEE